ncbi:MAG TPA: mechanosensitive ion channel domain-containing protein [archaeon]|nr:mechanosensitive ion channel domain-containing protein [archaeon]
MDLTVLKGWLFDPTVGKIITAILGILIIQVTSSFLQRSLTLRVKDTGTRYRVRKVIALISYLVMILFMALIFSDRLGRLAVAFGVAGAGIAFALQEVIVSIAAWFAISFGNFFKIGDRIQMGGIKGDVIDIAILRTTVMEIGQWVDGDLYNGRIVRIANSFLFKEPVFNYSADFPFLWDEITVPVKYGSDIRLARQIIQKVVQDIIGDYTVSAKETWKEMVNKYMIEEASVEPIVTLIARDSWLEFTARYIVDYKKRRSTKDLLFTQIMEGFQKTEGRVEITSPTVDLAKAPTFDVHLIDNQGKGQNSSFSKNSH